MVKLHYDTVRTVKTKFKTEKVLVTGLTKIFNKIEEAHEFIAEEKIKHWFIQEMRDGDKRS